MGGTDAGEPRPPVSAAPSGAASEPRRSAGATRTDSSRSLRRAGTGPRP